jgi:DNA-binding IclR family transcriptional regulator
MKQQDNNISRHAVEEGARPEGARTQGRSSSGVRVKPVVNAVRILRRLSQTGAPERAADIARHLSINPSTCFNILRTLVAEDVVALNPLSKTYSVGLGLAKLLEQLPTQGQRVELAKPYLRELAAEFHVTVMLWRRLGTDRIVLVSSEANPGNLRIEIPVGHRLPVLAGASGRVLAGQLGLDEKALRTEFAKIRWSRMLTFGTYGREVAKAGRRGWAVDDGYFNRGVVSVAAPVRDPSGTIAFTISAMRIRGQRDEAAIDAIGEALREVGAGLATVLF